MLYKLTSHSHVNAVSITQLLPNVTAHRQVNEVQGHDFKEIVKPQEIVFVVGNDLGIGMVSVGCHESCQHKSKIKFDFFLRFVQV